MAMTAGSAALSGRFARMRQSLTGPRAQHGASTAASTAASLVAQADALRDRKAYRQAASLYEAALSLAPDDAAIHVQCGHMFKEAGLLEPAGEHYAQARAMLPDDADLALQLGHFYKVSGRPADAACAYARALRLRPGWEEAAEEHHAMQAAANPSGRSEAPLRPWAPAREDEGAPGAEDARDHRRLSALERQVAAMAQQQAEALGAIRRSLECFDDARPDRVARLLAEKIAFKGDHVNALYRAFIGSEAPICATPAPVPFTSSLCRQVHFALDQYRFWVRALKDRPVFYRKQWEFVFIAQVLHEHGMLAGGRRGLAFGAGREPLPALFASFGAEIVATDQDAAAAAASGWTRSQQHAADLSVLNARGICTDRMFQELVSFMPVDMNAIPPALDGAFDFCWSACALEHLGSLRHGLDFMAAAMRTLKPGGIAVHTTEFNLSSNEDTLETPDVSFYRRRDIDSFVARMTGEGFAVAPIDWDLGDGFAETVVDQPPFGRGEPHIRLRSAGYDTTSIGLIITKPTR